MGVLKAIGEGILAGLVVEGILLVLSALANYFGLGLPFNLLLMKIPFWITLLAVLASLSSVAIYIRAKRRVGGVLLRIPRRPEYDVTIFDVNLFGVKWKVLYGTYFIGSEPYAFCDGGPYCPNCMYEMEAEKRGLIFKRYYWKCDRCGKWYKCPAKTPYDAKRIVEKMVESEVRSGRLRPK